MLCRGRLPQACQRGGGVEPLHRLLQRDAPAARGSLGRVRGRQADAFIWWQGENNRYDVETYPASLDDLLARVRAIQNPRRIVICGVGGMAGYEDFRAMQRGYALEHGLIFVPAEDLPRTQPGDFDVPSGGLWPGGDYNPHLTVEGYRIMAQRVAEALR